MDTGYPALITEPLASPDPKTQKPVAAVKSSETQSDASSKATGTPETPTPVP